MIPHLTEHFDGSRELFLTDLLVLLFLRGRLWESEREERSERRRKGEKVRESESKKK